MVQTSQSVPGQITAAMERAAIKSRTGTANLAPTQAIFTGQQKAPEENAADLAMLLAPGKPNNADGTERLD